MFFSDSATRAPGILIEARTGAGELAGRALTNASGAFTVVVPRSGSYEVRALRIGFRPTITAGIAGAPTGDAPRLRIVLGSVQVSLAAVQVRADDDCRVRADSGQLVAQVWEMARTALASTQASEGNKGIRVTGLVYQAWRELGGDRAQWQELSINDALAAKPFVSAPAEQLAAEGYARKESGQGMSFVAPDPEALISDAFAGSHCFRLVDAGDAYRGAIGVAFRPVRDRRGIVDIAGTFLLDRATGALRSLDYRYTNVPVDLERGGAGGHIEYLRLATGDWLVNRWSIKLPTVLNSQMVKRTVFAGGRPAGTTERDVGDLWMNVSGGELMAVDAGDSGDTEIFADSGVVWRGIVRSDGKPAHEVTIEVPDPGLFSIADSAGAVALSYASAGVREVLVSSRPMRFLGITPMRRRITLRPGVAAFPESIDLLGDEQLLAIKCGKDAVVRNRAALFGIARNADGAPLAHDSLFVRWLRADQMTNPAAIGGAPVEVVRTDSFGRWVVCGVSRGGQVLITPDEEGKKPTESLLLTIERNARLVEADVQWKLRK